MPACRIRRSGHDVFRGPELHLEETPPEGEETPLAWRGLALAIRALPPPRRIELVGEVDSWLSIAEARAHPFVEDLEEGASPLEGVRAWLLPVWNSACALLRNRFPVPGRNAWVTPSRPGAMARSGKMWAAWTDNAEQARDAEGELARFAAWAISHALLVDCGSLETTADAARRVQARLCEPESSIGVFALHPQWTVERSTPFDEIRALAERGRRLAARTRLSGQSAAPHGTDPRGGDLLTALLADVPTAEPAADLERWIELRPTEMLVVPRLGAIAKPAALVRELDVALSAFAAGTRIVNARPAR
jgi:hypothetical protein